MMSRSFAALTIQALWLAPGLVDAQVEVPSPSLHFRRTYNQIAVLGDYVFIEGGDIEQFVEGSADTITRPSNVTLTLPLNESWERDTVQFTEIDKGDKPAIREFTLWADQEGNRLYQWDGKDPAGSSGGAEDPRLWAFTPDDSGSGEWEVVPPANPDEYDALRRPAGGAGAVCGETAYVLGGYADRDTDQRVDTDNEIPMPGMVSLDMTNHEWRNQSLVPMSFPFGTYIGGKATCVEGLGNEDASYIFAVGGLTSDPTNAFEGTTMRDMGNVSFYDPSSDLWLWQNTTGETPPGRSGHCLAVAKSEFNTFEIYVYGGYNEDTGPLDDFWVLSLPSFEWFRVEGDHPRRRPEACALVGRSQLLFVGGGSDVSGEEPDPWAQSIGVFDLLGLEWSSGYRADADEYHPPEFVVDWYRMNNGTSGVSWSSPEVEARLGDIEIHLPEQKDDDSTPVESLGVMAGMMIGGLSFMFGITALGVLYVRRRKAKRTAAKAPEVEKAAASNFMAYSNKHELEAIRQAYLHRPRSSDQPGLEVTPEGCFVPHAVMHELVAERAAAELPVPNLPRELEAVHRGHGQRNRSKSPVVQTWI